MAIVQSIGDKEKEERGDLRLIQVLRQLVQSQSNATPDETVEMDQMSVCNQRKHYTPSEFFMTTAAFTWPPTGPAETQRSFCQEHPAQEVVSLEGNKIAGEPRASASWNN